MMLQVIPSSNQKIDIIENNYTCEATNYLVKEGCHWISKGSRSANKIFVIMHCRQVATAEVPIYAGLVQGREWNEELR